MNTDAYASVLGGLPYFNPLMIVNKSGTCAATKLVQCLDFGLDMNSASGKFLKDPDEIEASGEMPRNGFIARRDVYRRVEKWCDRNVKRGELRWTPILYAYEIVSTAAKRDQDWGHIIFTDATLSRFLLVMVFGQPSCKCGNPFHNDYGALTKLHADKFMCLVKYIYHEDDSPRPQWVHATYTTDSQLLPDSFMANTASAFPNSDPPIFHVTASEFIPSLTRSELERIDNLLARGRKQLPPRALREAVTRTKGTQQALVDAGADGTYSAGKTPVERECAFCRAVKTKLQVCSRCKLVEYCNKECQTKAWKYHKAVCKPVASTSAHRAPRSAASIDPSPTSSDSELETPTSLGHVEFSPVSEQRPLSDVADRYYVIIFLSLIVILLMYPFVSALRG